MRLPDLLREKGIDPEDFLERAKKHMDQVLAIWPDTLEKVRRGDYTHRIGYVDHALNWREQPEGWGFWEEIGHRWRRSKGKAMWPALEAAMGMLDSLEYELLEVGDEVT